MADGDSINYSVHINNPILSDIEESPTSSKFTEARVKDPLKQKGRRTRETFRDSSSSDYFYSYSDSEKGSKTIEAEEKSRLKRIRDARWNISEQHLKYITEKQATVLRRLTKEHEETVAKLESKKIAITKEMNRVDERFLLLLIAARYQHANNDETMSEYMAREAFNDPLTRDLVVHPGGEEKLDEAADFVMGKVLDGLSLAISRTEDGKVQYTT